MRILLSWLVLAIIIWLTAHLVPGIEIHGMGGAVLVAAVFGILNALLGWLLYITIGIGTLGIGFLFGFLTRLIVNAILLRFTGAITDALTVNSFGAAIIAALVMSVFGTLADLLIRKKDASL